jgi:hypothetical protein
MSLAELIIELFGFLILTFENSLHILDTGPLLGMRFENSLFQSVISFHLFNRIFHRA